MTTQSFHWNVTGPTAPMLHAMFGRHYREMHAALDRIAMRGRARGEPMASDYSDAVVLPTLGGATASRADQMVAVLVQAHEAVLSGLSAAIDVAEDCSDRATVRILAWREEMHGAHLAELRSLQSE